MGTGRTDKLCDKDRPGRINNVADVANATGPALLGAPRCDN